MTNQNFWKSGTRWGVFFVILFVICYIWLYFRGGADMKELHNNLLSLTFFGWNGLNLGSFILGLIQSFVWGYIAVALWFLSGKIVSSNKA